MERKETTRLIEEANSLIEQSALKAEEKKNLKDNIAFFLSRISMDSYVAGCTWAWSGDEEECPCLDLKWEWKDVDGVFGFYADNGHGFSFSFGETSKSYMFGGEDGDYGFSCGIFIHDLESQLAYMGY